MERVAVRVRPEIVRFVHDRFVNEAWRPLDKDRWRGDLKKYFVIETLTNDNGLVWRENLVRAAQKLRAKYKQSSINRDLELTMEKYLSKSPSEDILKAEAYKWLKHLYMENPPVGVSWFPRHAVHVAHAAFRLKGDLKTFQKYLSHGSRQVVFSTTLGEGLC